MDLPLLHFSAQPLEAVHSTSQAPEPKWKPAGLWVSAGHGDDSWPAWCNAEGFCRDRFEHATEVKLKQDARILLVDSLDAFDDFNGEFGAPYLIGHTDAIRWSAVAERYQGIVIAPYLWERRLSDSAFWYYGWDCASGCIWDADAVAALSPVIGLDLNMHAEEDA